MRIAVVGNIAGGKTVLSRALAKIHGVPLIHVDTIQFSAGMKIRPLEETREILNKMTQQEQWIIDGYGPLDLLELRFRTAEIIIFVDLSLVQHLYWLTKRQITSLWKKREELAEGCDEATLEHTKQLYRRLWALHTKMRPELLKLLSRESLKTKVVFVTNKKQWNQLYKCGVDWTNR